MTHPHELTRAWPASMLDVAERVRAIDLERPLSAVVADLRAIEREKDGYTTRGRAGRLRRPRPDGVACFNYLYLEVTEAVQQALEHFERPASVERLAVVFAEFYLYAYRAGADHAWVSKAWAPLFEDRLEPGVTPIQFALAGMNAHINNDLPWALLQVWEESGDPPGRDSADRRDFEHVNTILGRVQTEVRATLQSRFLAWLDRVLGRTDDAVATVSVARAREEAWDRAARWSSHFDPATAAAHERQVGYQGHLILAL